MRFIILTLSLCLVAQSAFASMFDFIDGTLFEAAKKPDISRLVGGMSTSMFSGRCWDKRDYADFAFNGALIAVKEGDAVKMFPFNQLLRDDGGRAGEDFFDDKMFRPWGDFYQIPIYYNVGFAFQRDGEWASVNKDYSQIYLVRELEGDYILRTAQIIGGAQPSVGETEIACRFSKRLPLIPLPEKPKDPVQEMLKHAVPSQPQIVILEVHDHNHYYGIDPGIFHHPW